MNEGTSNSVLFAEYVKKELVPILKNGDTFILENFSVHKTKGVMKSLVELGVHIIFLPAYSPDFNPIEMDWSKIKSFLRKDKPKTVESLLLAIKNSLKFIITNDAINWMIHCGYTQ